MGAIADAGNAVYNWYNQDKSAFDKYGNVQNNTHDLQDQFNQRFGGAPYNVADGDVSKSGLTNYMLRLWNDMDPIFECWLPEQFGFELMSEWEAPYANTAANAINGTGVGGVIANMAAASSGLTPRFRYTTMQFWQGNSPVSFSFRLQFRAEADAATEVVYPILLLASLSLPAEAPNSGILIAPAENHSIDAAKAWERIKVAYDNVVNGQNLPTPPSGIGGSLNLQIGDFLRVKDVFIKSMSPSFQTRFEARGLPIEADLDITFETRFTPTVQDVQSWFLAAPQTGANP